MSDRRGRGNVGRADLVRVGLRSNLAIPLGYALDLSHRVREHDTDADTSKSHGSDTQTRRAEFVEKQLAPLTFLQATRFAPLERREDTEIDAASVALDVASPVWENRPTTPPKFLPLADEARLRRLFARFAPGERRTRTPDTKRVVSQIAKARPLKRIPHRRYPAPRQLQIVVDRSVRLTPFWHDQVFALSVAPSETRLWRFEEASARFYPVGSHETGMPSPSDGPLLVLGDLGAFGDKSTAALWRDLGRDFVGSGESAFALLPCGQEDVTPEVAAIWDMVPWEPVVPGIDIAQRERDVEALLTWSSYASRLEPGLLRALRRKLTTADAVAELLVYRHRAVASPSAEAAMFDPGAIAPFRRRFEREALKNPRRAQIAWSTLRSWRFGIGDEFMFEELLSLPEEMRSRLKIDPRDISHAEAFWIAMRDRTRAGILTPGARSWLGRVGKRREADEEGLFSFAPAREAIMQATGANLSGPVVIRQHGAALRLGDGAGSLLATLDSTDGSMMVASMTERLPPALYVFRDSLSDGTEGPEMISIPTGAFLMGSSDDDDQAYDSEKPQHEVQITEPFALAKYPVTFEEYDTFCEATGREKPEDRGWGRGRRPAINVSWEDAKAYCAWLSDATDEPYRLPSEAEWEYACRAGRTTCYWWGDKWDPNAANGSDGGAGRTVEVGSYDPNPWGLHDSHGNVWEWCEDRWRDNYGVGRTQTAFLGSGGESYRVVRSGSWIDNARYCRAAVRDRYAPDGRGDGLGFRPARGQAKGASVDRQENAERSGFRSGEVGKAEPPAERSEDRPPRRGGSSDSSSSESVRRRVMPGGSVSVSLSDLPPAPFVIRTDRAELVIQRITHSDLGGWASGMGRDRFGLWADFSVDDIQQRLRFCPPGRFRMGSPEDEAGRYDYEGPQTEVTFEKGFWLFDTPVTQELYEAVVGKNPSRFVSPTRPVEQVDFGEAVTFIDALNERLTGLDLRLPAEAEWEYACRAGTTEATHAGTMEILGERNAPVLDGIAWYGGNSGVEFDLEEGHDSSDWPEKQFEHNRAGTMPVKLKRANPWGLYDMLGNTFEWCEDGWHDSHEGAALDGSPRTGSRQVGGSLRVVRSGSWYDVAWYCRAAVRGRGAPDLRGDNLGFRPARG